MLRPWLARAASSEEVDVCCASELFDGLVFTGLLGAGAFGRVLKGLWQGSNVAVKVIVTPESDANTRKEVMLTEGLRHPHVVQAFSTRTAFLSLAEYQDLMPVVPFKQEAASEGAEYEKDCLDRFDSGMGFGSPSATRVYTPTEVWRMSGALPDHFVTIIVMELCDKGTLLSIIKQGAFRAAPGKWGDQIAKRCLIRTACELAKGMVYLHSSGIVHGDLKPANCLLVGSRADRRGFALKVGDFGLSQVMMAQQSFEVDSGGTFPYMSPEHLNGRLNKPCDVWSFGAVLWQMLTGRHPHSGLMHVQILVGVVDGSLELEWPAEEEEALPGLVQLGRDCLNLNPSLRPTFEEVVSRLLQVEEEVRLSQRRRNSEAGT